MAETILVFAYALLLLGVLLVFIGKTRPGIKLIAAGVLLVVKTLAVLSLLGWMRQHVPSAGDGEIWWWLVAIPVAALMGVLVGAVLVALALLRAIKRLIALPHARAALGGAVIGTLASEMLRRRNDRDDRRIR